MKQTTIPIYIRFGEIPRDGQSKVHRSDDVLRQEGGVSVWRAVEDQGKYWPLMPEEPNDNTIADYFSMLLDWYHSNKNVYLVTGHEICIEGADREPLLWNCQIIKDISWQYKHHAKDDESVRLSVLKELQEFGILTKADIRKYNKMKEEKDEEIRAKVHESTESE